MTATRKTFGQLTAEDAGLTLVWKQRARTRRGVIDRVEQRPTHTVAHIRKGRGVEPLVLAQEDPVTVEL